MPTCLTGLLEIITKAGLLRTSLSPSSGRGRGSADLEGGRTSRQKRLSLGGGTEEGALVRQGHRLST